MRRFLLPFFVVALFGAAPLRAENLAYQNLAYHLGQLTAAQRDDLMQHLDRYAAVEVFLKACGRPPALEARFRRLVAGCVRPDSLDTLAGAYRRALASRAHLRWDCHSEAGRRMIERCEASIRTTAEEVGRLCRQAREAADISRRASSP